jgi:hypothetical protein
MSSVNVCKSCLERKFNVSTGFVCRLSNAKPEFLGSCPNYIQDNQALPALSTSFTRPNSLRAKYAQVLIWVVLVIQIVTLLSHYLQYELIIMLINGEEVSESLMYSNDTRQQIIAIIYLIVAVVSAVTFIRWFRRGYFNLNQRIKHTQNSDGWAVGGWFVPFICLYRPYRIMQEMWNETHILLVKSNDFSFNKQSVIGWWWAMWIISALIGNIAFRLMQKAETLDALLSSTTMSMLLALTEIPLAILTVKMIRDYTEMENRLVEVEQERLRNIA